MNEAEKRNQSLHPTPSAEDGDELQRTESELDDRWQRAKFVFRAIEVRLRFIALFVVIGLLMLYWRTIENYWDRWTRPSSQAAAAELGTEYYCPMHPSVIRPGLEPNGSVPSCPICGMPLSKRNKGEVPTLPEGVTARVQLTPERVKLAGIETVAASYMPLAKEVRTVGYVAYDERRLSDIVTRVSGYLEKLFVDNTFVMVTEGEPLAEIYSPELYSSVQELLLAEKYGSKDLVVSSRQRLKLLGISDTEIDNVLASSEDRPRLLIRSPQSGQVVKKNVVEGASVEAGTTLFKIADLTEVWIEADVFERDLSFLREGQSVEATIEAIPGRKFAGEISLIYPELNPETRTNRVRIAVENSDLLLRPGMYATVLVKTAMSETEPFRAQLASRQMLRTNSSDAERIAQQKVCPVTGAKLGSMGKPVKFELANQTVFLCCDSCAKTLRESPEKYLERLSTPPEGTVLSIPENAVIDTGRSKVVYVERELGLFEGVEVELGPRAGGYYPVLAGLSSSDRVAAAGSFLLDAETRLNPAAASSYFGASGGPANGGTTTGNGSGSSSRRSKTDKAKELSAAQLNNIAKLPPADQRLAEAQAVCPITGEPLGSMGVPVKVMVAGTPIFLCCQSCEREVRDHPEKVLEKLPRSTWAPPATSGPASSPAAGHQH